MAFELTKQQQNFFEVFGYLKLSGLFKAHVETLQTAFDEIYAKYQSLNWQHEAHYNKPRYIIHNFVEKHPELRKLITHGDIQAIFSQLLGADYSFISSEGNVFTGDTYWHSDLYGCHFKYRYIKALFYLDTLTANTGALCVIPGSHQFGDQYANKLQAQVWEHERHLGIQKSEIPYVAIPTEPGDIILFDYRLKHATYNATDSKRRMFNLCATQQFAEEDEYKLIETFNAIISAGGEVHSKAFLNSLTNQERTRISQTIKLLTTQNF